MDVVRESIAAIADGLGVPGTAAAIAGLVMLEILLVALIVHRRRGRRAASDTTDQPAPTLTEPTVGTIRRPLYADPLLLDDLLAHAETRDYGRALRATLDDESAATAETRKINKVLTGLEQRRMLVNLDDDPEAALATGTAVRVTGTLEELPASDVAELLELSAPVLVHSTRSSSNGHSGNGQALAAGTTSFTDDAPEPSWGAGAKVLALTTEGSDRRYLVVLHPDGARNLDRRPLAAGPVTVLGVAEDVLGRRDKLDIDDYLGPYLSSQVRDRVRGSRLSDAAESVAQLAGSKVRKRDLTFEGPGARLSVAAVYRE